MKSFHCTLFLMLVCPVILAGCGDSDSSSFAQAQEGDTQGMVLAMISNSTDPDSDGDYLPDDVEGFLGTDPEDRDTDHDGMPDLVEIFGTGTVNENDLIPNRDGDPAIAAVDPDDNADGINDGQQLDSDGDGISNYLEYYGFTYNWMSGQYAPWDGTDYSEDFYKTDPHQKSTDQDPFDDDVEVTGVNMDVSVQEPGNMPMVAAYPEILVRLEGYAVTLNKELTWSVGESLAEGTTWERTSGTTHSNTTERNWEIGVSTEISYSLISFGGSTTFHSNYGEKYGSTSGSSYSVSTGKSVLSEHNWSRASTENPTDVAHIKLFLKVYNNGSAVASNVVPTMTLKVGGHNVATFEPGNARINLLEPGGVYPAAPGVYWVVDSIDTGANIAPISLTLSELKALESGAPVSVTLTQMSADVMLRTPETGVYESVGDWNEYMARIRAVSANLFFDIGDGNVLRALVYADDGLTAPTVTLGDALVWAAGARHDTVTDEVLITYYDQASGSYREKSLEGWHFTVDGGTYEANGFSNALSMPAGFNIATLRLNPDSFVVAKAPRDQVPDAGAGPEIHAAYYDPTTGGINVVASDYNGIEKVEFVDKDGEARPMEEDITGSSYYVYAPALDNANYPDGYAFDGSEVVRVTNVNGEFTEQSFIEVYIPPEPEPPSIVSVSVDLQLHKLHAHVESEIPLDAEPAFVRVYSEVFKAPDYGDGYCEMKRVSNWFEDPTGWVCDLAPTWTDFSVIEGMTVVAYAGPDLIDYREVTPADQYAHITGSGIMRAALNTFYLYPDYNRTTFDTIDLDTGRLFWYSATLDIWDFKLNDLYLPFLLLLDYRPYDFWFRIDVNHWYAHFGVDSLLLGDEADPGVDFDALDRGAIKGMVLEPWFSPWPVFHDSVNRVFIYRTDQGRYGKLRLTSTGWYVGGYDMHGIKNYGRVAVASYEFVTFLREDEQP